MWCEKVWNEVVWSEAVGRIERLLWRRAKRPQCQGQSRKTTCSIESFWGVHEKKRHKLFLLRNIVRFVFQIGIKSGQIAKYFSLKILIYFSF